MAMLFSDTSPAVEQMLIEGYRRMNPWQKLWRVVSLNHTLYTLAAARLRTQYGNDMTERELRLRLASLRLTRTMMIRVFNWDPEEHGY